MLLVAPLQHSQRPRLGADDGFGHGAGPRVKGGREVPVALAVERKEHQGGVQLVEDPFRHQALVKSTASGAERVNDHEDRLLGPWRGEVDQRLLRIGEALELATALHAFGVAGHGLVVQERRRDREQTQQGQPGEEERGGAELLERLRWGRFCLAGGLATEPPGEQAAEGHQKGGHVGAHAGLAERVELHGADDRHHDRRDEGRAAGQSEKLGSSARCTAARHQQIGGEGNEEAKGADGEEADRDPAPDPVAQHRRIGAVERDLTGVFCRLGRGCARDEAAAHVVQLPVQMGNVVEGRKGAENEPEQRPAQGNRRRPTCVLLPHDDSLTSPTRMAQAD